MMKHWIIGAALAAAVAINSSLAGAQVTPAQRVLVIPFTTLNLPESQQWIAKGVEENIVADFGRNGGWSPVAFQGQVIVEDNATAARLGRQAAADYAIRGSAQVVGESVRLTAQLIETKSGDTLSTAAVTGSPKDLLRLEDELSSQLRLGPSTASAGGATTAPAMVAEEPAQPQVVVITQPSSPALGYDNSYYNNPYALGYGYGSGFPGVIWPVVIPIDNGHHHHGHDNDDCPPTPPHHVPTPPTRHAFPTPPKPTGFTLPIPQSGGGFALPIPQSGGGFGLPIPQTSAPVQRIISAPVQQARPSPVMITAPRMTAPVMNSAPRIISPAPAARSVGSPMQYTAFRR